MRGIIFDLDGTLLDTLEDLADGVNYALTVHGYPSRSIDEVRQFVGNGAGRLIRLATDGGKDQEAVLATFQDYYGGHCRRKTGPYAGILPALEGLKRKYALGIVSNKPDGAVKTLCREYFPGVLAMGETADCPRKPDPAMVRRAMAALGTEECVYVGDSEVDVQTGKNAGLPCLSVLWGFRGEAFLRAAGAEHFCHTPRELEEKIESLIEAYYGK